MVIRVGLLNEVEELGGGEEAGLADDAAAVADAAMGCAAPAVRGLPPAISTDATGPSRRRASKGGKSSNKYRL